MGKEKERKGKGKRKESKRKAKGKQKKSKRKAKGKEKKGKGKEREKERERKGKGNSCRVGRLSACMCHLFVPTVPPQMFDNKFPQ